MTTLADPAKLEYYLVRSFIERSGTADTPAKIKHEIVFGPVDESKAIAEQATRRQQDYNASYIVAERVT